MSRCGNCVYNYNTEDLCIDSLRLIDGAGCPRYKAITTKQPDICVLCAGINDQEHLGKMFCSECEKKYVK